jgi:hypothetical protein
MTRPKKKKPRAPASLVVAPASVNWTGDRAWNGRSVSLGGARYRCRECPAEHFVTFAWDITGDERELVVREFCEDDRELVACTASLAAYFAGAGAIVEIVTVEAPETMGTLH